MPGENIYICALLADVAELDDRINLLKRFLARQTADIRTAYPVELASVRRCFAAFRAAIEDWDEDDLDCNEEAIDAARNELLEVIDVLLAAMGEWQAGCPN